VGQSPRRPEIPQKVQKYFASLPLLMLDGRYGFEREHHFIEHKIEFIEHKIETSSPCTFVKVYRS
jgi:hypothetical protein